MGNQIVNGMDLGKLEEFRAALAEEPVVLGLEARGVWEGYSGRSTVHIGPYELGGQRIERDTRHYTVPYGAWKEVEEAVGFSSGQRIVQNRSKWRWARLRPAWSTASP